MLTFLTTRIYAFIGYGIAVVLLIAGIALHLRADARLRDRHETLQAEAGVVVEATRLAANNPELEWAETAGQIVALGETVGQLRVSITTQNQAINEMAREAVRLRAHAAELQAIANRAQEQRRAALERLSDMSATPGTRSDCMTLILEAEEALDLVRSAGL